MSCVRSLCTPVEEQASPGSCVVWPVSARGGAITSRKAVLPVPPAETGVRGAVVWAVRASACPEELDQGQEKGRRIPHVYGWGN